MHSNEALAKVLPWRCQLSPKRSQLSMQVFKGKIATALCRQWKEKLGTDWNKRIPLQCCIENPDILEI